MKIVSGLHNLDTENGVWIVRQALELLLDEYCRRIALDIEYGIQIAQQAFEPLLYENCSVNTENGVRSPGWPAGGFSRFRIKIAGGLPTLDVENGVRVAQQAVNPLVDESEGVENDGDHHHEEHLTKSRDLCELLYICFTDRNRIWIRMFFFSHQAIDPEA
jgi:hypothetical protein